MGSHFADEIKTERHFVYKEQTQTRFARQKISTAGSFEIIGSKTIEVNCFFFYDGNSKEKLLIPLRLGCRTKLESVTVDHGGNKGQIVEYVRKQYQEGTCVLLYGSQDDFQIIEASIRSRLL